MPDVCTAAVARTRVRGLRGRQSGVTATCCITTHLQPCRTCLQATPQLGPPVHLVSSDRCTELAAASRAARAAGVSKPESIRHSSQSRGSQGCNEHTCHKACLRNAHCLKLARLQHSWDCQLRPKCRSPLPRPGPRCWGPAVRVGPHTNPLATDVSAIHATPTMRATLRSRCGGTTSPCAQCTAALCLGRVLAFTLRSIPLMGSTRPPECTLNRRLRRAGAPTWHARHRLQSASLCTRALWLHHPSLTRTCTPPPHPQCQGSRHRPPPGGRACLCPAQQGDEGFAIVAWCSCIHPAPSVEVPACQLHPAQVPLTPR